VTREPEDVTRLLIADDHASFRSGLRTLLATADGMTVVGEAASGAEAIALARRLQPDVVLMDLAMPDLDGVEATRRIADVLPHVAVLVLTMSDEDDSVLAAVRAGARGYLLKGAQRAEILRAVRAVAAGEAIFGPAVARRLSGFVDRPEGAASIGLPFPELTAREREILDLVARGRSNAEITARLVVSPKTVRNHISNIFSKLELRDRAEAIVRAREAGMGGEVVRRG
jgi:DNA-binding NarL/FixJ family response regulator